MFLIEKKQMTKSPFQGTLKTTNRAEVNAPASGANDLVGKSQGDLAFRHQLPQARQILWRNLQKKAIVTQTGSNKAGAQVVPDKYPQAFGLESACCEMGLFGRWKGCHCNHSVIYPDSMLPQLQVFRLGVGSCDQGAWI